MLPTDSGVMRHASDQATRLAMQGNQFTMQTGMNIASEAGQAVKGAFDAAEFQRRGDINRSRLATESLRRQELKMRMGQYQEELALRRDRMATMQDEQDLKERLFRWNKQMEGEESYRENAETYGRYAWKDDKGAYRLDHTGKNRVYISDEEYQGIMGSSGSRTSLEEWKGRKKAEADEAIRREKAKYDMKAKDRAQSAGIRQEGMDIKAAGLEQRKLRGEKEDRKDEARFLYNAAEDAKKAYFELNQIENTDEQYAEAKAAWDKAKADWENFKSGAVDEEKPSPAPGVQRTGDPDPNVAPDFNALRSSLEQAMKSLQDRLKGLNK